MDFCSDCEFQEAEGEEGPWTHDESWPEEPRDFGQGLSIPRGNDLSNDNPGYLSFEVNGRPMFQFLSTNKFVGQRRGFIFKTGDRGVGYYVDSKGDHGAGVRNDGSQTNEQKQVVKLCESSDHCWPEYICRIDQGKQLANAGVPAEGQSVALPLHELLFNEAFALEGSRRRLKRKRPKRKRNRVGRGRKWSGDLQPPSHVEAQSAWHIDEGLWALDTINPNQLSGLASYLETSNSDVVMAQEGREDDPLTLLSREASAKKCGWNLYPVPALRTEADGLSAGVAIASRAFYGMSKGCLEGVPDTFKPRIACAHVGAFCRGGVHIISAYFWCAEGLSRRNLDLMHYLAMVIHSLSGPWILGADFNMPPDVVESSGWLQLIKGKVVVAEAPTCGLSKYDYFIVDSRLGGAVVGAALVVNAGFHPHCPARLFMRKGCRQLVKRVLVHSGKSLRCCRMGAWGSLVRTMELMLLV